MEEFYVVLSWYVSEARQNFHAWGEPILRWLLRVGAILRGSQEIQDVGALPCLHGPCRPKIEASFRLTRVDPLQEALPCAAASSEHLHKYYTNMLQRPLKRALSRR